MAGVLVDDDQGCQVKVIKMAKCIYEHFKIGKTLWDIKKDKNGQTIFCQICSFEKGQMAILLTIVKNEAVIEKMMWFTESVMGEGSVGGAFVHNSND